MSLDVHLTPNACPHCGRGDEGYGSNITHNLNDMADAASIYGVVWYPEEHGITLAEQLIEPLRKAIADMKARPAYFRRFNATNGWGTYENFVTWLERYLAACEKMPKATVSVSR